MNIHRFTIASSSPMLIAAACAALIGSHSFAQSPSQRKSDGKLTVVDAEHLDGQSDGRSHSIELRIVDGEITVKRDGKEVPKDRIKKEGGSIIILDENGNELKDFMIGVPRFGGKAWQGFFDGQNALRGFAVNEAEAPKVMLGVHMGEPSAELEYHLGLEHGTSTVISGLYEGLPAHEAGLNQHDVIIKVDGKEPADAATIKKTLAEKNPDDVVTFTVIQKGKTRDIKVKLAGFDAQKMQSSKVIGQSQTSLMGQLLGGEGFEHMWRPQLEGEIENLFVVPGSDGRKQMELIAPRIAEKMQRFRFPSDEQKDGGVENQLNRLDERMAELEQMLQKLLDQQERRDR